MPISVVVCYPFSKSQVHDGAAVFSEMDLTHGFYQALITNDTKPSAAVVSPFI